MVNARLWAPWGLLIVSAFSGCGGVPASPTLTATQESIEEQSRVVQVLQKQVRDRDRRIAVLRVAIGNFETD